MELVKKNIHMNKSKCKSNLQLTLEDDFNVPDSKPDVEKIIKTQGEVKFEEQKANGNKLHVRGALVFQTLYISEEHSHPIHSMNAQIPFDETIHMETDCNQDEVTIRVELEDLSSGLINSRKLSVRALLHLSVSADEIHDEEGAVATEEDGVQTIFKTIDVTGIAVSKKDAYRFRDEIVLPSGKGSISELLYNEIDLKNTDIRLLADKFTVKGEISVFFLYAGEGEETPFEYYETELPFSASIDCNGCMEEMIQNILITLGSTNLEVKPDADGEERLVSVEAVLDMTIRIYEEVSLELVKDLYSPAKNLTPIFKNVTYENLMLKNTNKAKVTGRVKINSDDPRVLQICHARGTAKIDELIKNETGLMAEGIIETGIFYISADDEKPLQALKAVLTFSQQIEVANMSENSLFEVWPEVEQVSVMMLDTEEVEVKAVLALNATIFEQKQEQFMVDVNEEPLDYEKLQKMPGLIGYVVKAEDSLWDIAKRYYTTVNAIKELNELETDQIATGDHLLILKEAAKFL